MIHLKSCCTKRCLLISQMQPGMLDLIKILSILPLLSLEESVNPNKSLWRISILSQSLSIGPCLMSSIRLQVNGWRILSELGQKIARLMPIAPWASPSSLLLMSQINTSSKMHNASFKWTTEELVKTKELLLKSNKRWLKPTWLRVACQRPRLFLVQWRDPNSKMPWMRTLTHQYAWTLDLLVTHSLQDPSLSSLWWNLILRKIRLSQAADQTSLFIKQSKFQTQVIHLFTTKFCRIQQRPLNRTHLLVWSVGRASELCALNSIQSKLVSTTFRLSGSIITTHLMCRKWIWLDTAMNLHLFFQMTKSCFSHQFTKEFPVNSKFSWKMNPEFLCSTSGKCPTSTRTR